MESPRVRVWPIIERGAEHHVVVLETAVLTAFCDGQAGKHKTRRPPSPAAAAQAARLQGLPASDPAARVVIDMSTDADADAAARLARTTPSTVDGDDTAMEEMQ